MLKNPWVRIALIVVLILVLYYLVVTLARGVAGATPLEGPRAASEPIGDLHERR